MLLPSAALWWEVGKKWIIPLREVNKYPHLYENVEWLAKRENDLLAAKRGSAAPTAQARSEGGAR
jgi:hypothetical protein